MRCKREIRSYSTTHLLGSGERQGGEGERERGDIYIEREGERERERERERGREREKEALERAECYRHGILLTCPRLLKTGDSFEEVSHGQSIISDRRGRL